MIYKKISGFLFSVYSHLWVRWCVVHFPHYWCRLDWGRRWWDWFRPFLDSSGFLKINSWFFHHHLSCWQLALTCNTGRGFFLARLTPMKRAHALVLVCGQNVLRSFQLSSGRSGLLLHYCRWFFKEFRENVIAKKVDDHRQKAKAWVHDRNKKEGRESRDRKKF